MMQTLIFSTQSNFYSSDALLLIIWLMVAYNGAMLNDLYY